jgi:hypothetical protein
MATKDIRIATGIFNNHKIKKLITACGYDGFIALMKLWCYAGDCRTKGVLTAMDETDILSAMGLITSSGKIKRDANKIFSTIKSLKFLEIDRDNNLHTFYKIHDWSEHQGFIYHESERIEKAKKAAKARWDKELTENERAQQDMLRAMLPASSPDATSMLRASENHATSNAPSPSPSPNPNIREANILHDKKILSELPPPDISPDLNLDKGGDKEDMDIPPPPNETPDFPPEPDELPPQKPKAVKPMRPDLVRVMLEGFQKKIQTALRDELGNSGQITIDEVAELLNGSNGRPGYGTTDRLKFAIENITGVVKSPKKILWAFLNNPERFVDGHKYDVWKGMRPPP